MDPPRALTQLKNKTKHYLLHEYGNMAYITIRYHRCTMVVPPQYYCKRTLYDMTTNYLQLQNSTTHFVCVCEWKRLALIHKALFHRRELAIRHRNTHFPLFGGGGGCGRCQKKTLEPSALFISRREWRQVCCPIN